MSEGSATPGRREPDGVGEALRAAIERTMEATAGSAASTRGRASELVDDVVRRGREAGALLARRGQEATDELGKRLESLERRLAELESNLAADPRSDPEGREGAPPSSNPKAEG